MAEGSAGTSDRDLAEAGPSGINREVDRQPTALEVAEGLHSDTNLIASTVREPPRRPTPPPRVPTPVPRNVPTPVPRTSRPETPTLNNVAGSRPATPALQLRPIAGLLPLAQPPQGDQPEIQSSRIVVSVCVQGKPMLSGQRLSASPGSSATATPLQRGHAGHDQDIP